MSARAPPIIKGKGILKSDKDPTPSPRIGTLNKEGKTSNLIKA